MARYEVQPGVQLTVGGRRKVYPDVIEGEFDRWASKGWVKKLSGDSSSAFPIEDYDDLKAVEIIPLLSELSKSEVEKVLSYEKEKSRPRKSIIKECWQQLRDK